MSKLSSHRNAKATKNPDEPFPLSRVVLICGDCSPEDCQLPCHVTGCCGLKMRATLVLTDGDPYLEIKEFILPSTSKHKVQSMMMNDTSDEPIRHQSMLEPGPTNLIKALGRRQAKISLVLSVLDDTYPHLKVNKSLIHTMLRKGRDEKYGDNDDNSMVMFLEYDIGIKGQGGTFNVTMCDLTSQLE